MLVVGRTHDGQVHAFDEKALNGLAERLVIIVGACIPHEVSIISSFSKWKQAPEKTSQHVTYNLARSPTSTPVHSSHLTRDNVIHARTVFHLPHVLQCFNATACHSPISVADDEVTLAIPHIHSHCLM